MYAELSATFRTYKTTARSCRERSTAYARSANHSKRGKCYAGSRSKTNRTRSRNASNKLRTRFYHAAGNRARDDSNPRRPYRPTYNRCPCDARPRRGGDPTIDDALRCLHDALHSCPRSIITNCDHIDG